MGSKKLIIAKLEENWMILKK